MDICQLKCAKSLASGKIERGSEKTEAHHSLSTLPPSTHERSREYYQGAEAIREAAAFIREEVDGKVSWRSRHARRQPGHRLQKDVRLPSRWPRESFLSMKWQAIFLVRNPAPTSSVVAICSWSTSIKPRRTARRFNHSHSSQTRASFRLVCGYWGSGSWYKTSGALLISFL